MQRDDGKLRRVCVSSFDQSFSHLHPAVRATHKWRPKAATAAFTAALRYSVHFVPPC